jgi:hypothetical protein
MAKGVKTTPKSIMKIKAGAGSAVGRLQRAAAQAKKGK